MVERMDLLIVIDQMSECGLDEQLIVAYRENAMISTLRNDSLSPIP